MQSFVLTASGQALMTALIAGTTTATFTKMQTSDHSYAASEIANLTALLDVKQEEAISSIEPGDVSGTVKMLARIENSLLEEGYYIRTVGIIAKDNTTDDEILYAVSIAGVDEIPGYMPAFSGQTPTGITFTFIVEVSNAERVVMVVDPAATATVAQIEDLQDQIDNIQITAYNTSYDNSGSGLLGANVQDAIDEVAATSKNNTKNLMATAIAFEMYSSIDIPGLNNNINVETFTNTQDISISEGLYDSTNKRLYA